MRRLYPFGWPLVLFAATLPACAHVDSRAPSIADVGVCPSVEKLPSIRRASAAVKPGGAGGSPAQASATRGNEPHAPPVEPSPSRVAQVGYQAQDNQNQELVPPPPPQRFENAPREPSRAVAPPRAEAAYAPGTLTLEKLQNLALRNNPTLPLARSEVQKERGRWVQIGLYPNPTVGYVRGDNSVQREGQTNGVLVQQTIITAHKLQKNRAIESFGIRSTGFQLDAQRLRVMNDVRRRYLEVAGAKMRLDLLEDIRDSTEQAAQAAKQLFRALEASRADVLQAEAQLDALELAVQNAEAEYRAAWKRLAVIVGVPDLPAQALAEPAEKLPDFDFETQLQRLLAANPVLKSSQAQVGVARSQLARDRVTPIPDVTVQVVAERDRVNNFSTVNTLIALPLPLFNRNQGKIYTSFHEYRRASQEVERVRLVLRDQLVSSHNAYIQAKNAAEKLRDEILPKRREAHDLVVQGYRQGEFGFLTVLNSQQILLDASMKYATTLTQARQLAVEIEGLQLTGGLNPATIGTAIQETGAGGGRRRAVQGLLEQQQNQRLNNFAPTALQ